MSFVLGSRQGDPAGRPASLWRNRDFVLISGGQIVSVLGSRVSSLALPLLVLALTHSPALAGLLLALDLLPWLLLSLPLGALIDRWDRQRVMIRCDLVRFGALGSVPVAFALGRLGVAQLAVVAFVGGTATVCFELAQLAALPNIVPASQLARAYSITEVTTATSKLAGPPLGGLLIGLARTTVVGAMLAYLVDSVTYLVSAVTLRSMRVAFQGQRVAEGQQSLWRAMAEGLRLLWGQPILRTLAALTAAVNFLLTSLTLVIIVKATALGARPVVLGLIFGIAGAGGLLGGVVAPSLRARLRLGQVILGAVVLWAVAVASLAVASVPLALAVGATLIDLIWPIYGVVVVTYRLAQVPDALQGRINSSFRFVSYGSEALGGAVGGIALAALGPQRMLWGICAGLVLLVVVASRTRLRRA